MFAWKHAIDLTDMFLHLCKHPFVFLVKQVLYFLLTHRVSHSVFC